MLFYHFLQAAAWQFVLICETPLMASFFLYKNRTSLMNTRSSSFDVAKCPNGMNHWHYADASTITRVEDCADVREAVAFCEWEHRSQVHFSVFLWPHLIFIGRFPSRARLERSCIVLGGAGHKKLLRTGPCCFHWSKPSLANKVIYVVKRRFPTGGTLVSQRYMYKCISEVQVCALLVSTMTFRWFYFVENILDVEETCRPIPNSFEGKFEGSMKPYNMADREEHDEFIFQDSIAFRSS